jgi:hypothetical protein
MNAMDEPVTAEAEQIEAAELKKMFDMGYATHTCRVELCLVTLATEPEGLLFCPEHWSKLPKAYKHTLLETYGGPGWTEAVETATQVLRAQERMMEDALKAPARAPAA